MDFDFSLVLVVLVSVCGVITLLDILVFEKRRQPAQEAGLAESVSEGPSSEESPSQKRVPTAPAPMPLWIEYPRSFFPVLLIVLLLRSFLVEPFKIPSGSMLPTLRIGDYILVNKFEYGLRLPVVGTKIVSLGEPDRGDVLVFKYPVDPKINYIKRVVGLPGDKIVYNNKYIVLNDVRLPYELNAETRDAYFLTETLGSIDHSVRVSKMRPAQSGEWVVPEGHYFVMGDNRDNSLDSRAWGFVPESYIVGRAFAIWMHMPGLVPSFSRNGGID